MSFFSRMNPTLRGFLIIAAIVAVIVVLQLEATLVALLLIARIAFLLAIVFFVYLMWRERRGEIDSWSTRERVVFYGAALLIVAAIGLYFWHGLPGYEQLGFLGVVVGAGYAMFRVWRGRHSYS